VTIGITKYAAEELSDLTYVEMRPVGTGVDEGEVIGEIESVKTTSDVYSSVAGEIVEVNAAAAADPSLLNSDPFGEGWLVRIRAEHLGALKNLMDQRTYDAKYPVAA